MQISVTTMRKAASASRPDQSVVDQAVAAKEAAKTAGLRYVTDAESVKQELTEEWRELRPEAAAVLAMLRQRLA